MRTGLSTWLCAAFLTTGLVACGPSPVGEWLGGDRELSADPTLGSWFVNETQARLVLDDGTWRLSTSGSEPGCQTVTQQDGTFTDDVGSAPPTRTFVQTSSRLIRTNCVEATEDGTFPSDQSFAGTFTTQLAWVQDCSGFEGSCSDDHVLTLTGSGGLALQAVGEQYDPTLSRTLTLKEDGTWRLQEQRSYGAQWAVPFTNDGCTDDTEVSGKWLESTPGVVTFSDATPFTRTRTGCTAASENRTGTLSAVSRLAGAIPYQIVGGDTLDTLALTVNGLSASLTIGLLQGPCPAGSLCPTLD